MDVTNASMYDGATALAEAIMMAIAQTGRHEVLISRFVNPNYIAVVRSYLAGQKVKIRLIEDFEGFTSYSDLKAKLTPRTAAVVIQNPNFIGELKRLPNLLSQPKKQGRLLSWFMIPYRLVYLASSWRTGRRYRGGRRSAAGIASQFWRSISWAYFRPRKEFIRRIPGRLSGRTKDKDGATGFVLTLQTREQHIRRDRATSNICTNQALCALAATVYLSLLGKIGLEKVGKLCLSKAHYAASKITSIPGFSLEIQRTVLQGICD